VFAGGFKLHEVVAEMIISAEESVTKPDQRIYQIAICWLGVWPEEAVFADDLAENLQVARSFGMWSLQFKSTQ
jgi:HAD superfamily hydrolase (TIGR01509 family)